MTPARIIMINEDDLPRGSDAWSSLRDFFNRLGISSQAPCKRPVAYYPVASGIYYCIVN